MEKEDMPFDFGNDPCDDVVHWLIWIKKELKRRDTPDDVDTFPI